MRLASPIIHQKQPTPCSCTATCIAMAVGVPVETLGIDLSRAYDFDKFGVWLAERGIWLRVADRGESFHQDTLYLVGVRSMNIVWSDHAVLVDTRGERKVGEGFYERSHWKTFDPCEGIEGKKVYHWADEHQATNFCELRQHDPRYVRAGSPP